MKFTAGSSWQEKDSKTQITRRRCILRTTDEMLEEFAYLGSAKAREVVIDNPQKIARYGREDLAGKPEQVSSGHRGFRSGAYEISVISKAHEMYGEDLPVQVSSRLEKELNSIISNGYAVMYIIAQKLVWKSNADGYLVGSRGSVGSSFVATMSGITEVNPLSPHYYCAKMSLLVILSLKRFGHLPEAVVTICRIKIVRCAEKTLVKAGFDIPFETFLGFKGDKEPDIDLNFSGDYQSEGS